MKLGSFAAGFALGALTLYYADRRQGGYRRALVRDKLLSAGHRMTDIARGRSQRMADQTLGVLATGHLDRVSRSEPASDHQLHERIRARLGHVVDHPKAVEVSVSNGQVTLRGAVLSGEHDRLLHEVRNLAGVVEVTSELSCHEHPDSLSQAHAAHQRAGASLH